MTSYERLEMAKKALADKLPAELKTAGLPEFEVFQIGAPEREDENTISVVTMSNQLSPERESWTLCVILQCYDYGDVYQLESLLLDKLPQILPAENLGMQTIDELESEVSPPMQQRTILIFVSITYISVLDA